MIGLTSPCSELEEVVEAAYPTNRILPMVLFIAFAMITVKIKPLAPTSEPATIKTLLTRIKPANAAAIPERELSNDITTGMSPPPIGRTKPTPPSITKARYT